MDIFTEKLTLKTHLSKLKAQNKTIGFIPTMGALHKGHLSLIKKAQKKNDIVVVSIFVNPTQFNKAEDLINYPKTLENDIQLLKSVACNVLFHPSVKEVYGKNTVSEKFNFDGLEHEMEGKYRDGHFDGVGTVVKTLFEIVNPDTAYFGQKDFQQLRIIEKFIEEKFPKLELVSVSTARNEEGIAYSSRNENLSKKQLQEFINFHNAVIQFIKDLDKQTSINDANIEAKKFITNLSDQNFDYFEFRNANSLELEGNISEARLFYAIYKGQKRLIDNIDM